MGIMMIAGTERRRQGCSLQDGKQWGTNTIGSRTTRTEAYPLPYSEFCLPIVSGKGYVGGLNYGFGVGVTNFGLTSVTIANNSEDSSYRWTGYTYIVVGAQPQWGFTNNTGRPYITFPFKFSNVFTAISCICHNGSPSEANTVYNVSISGMNIGASGGGSGKYWCAFGVAQQQWGYSNSTGVTFPIAFKECYAVVSNAHSNTTGNTDHYHLLSWTSTGAAFGYWYMSFYGTHYIALGVE